MKKRPIIYCVLFSAVLLLFAESAFSEEKRENAATYYQEALAQCRYSYKSRLGEKIKDLIKEGWSPEDKGLEKILQNNESALVEFEKGVKLKTCDFTFGKEYDNPLQEPIPNLAKVRDLTHLILLQGRLDERNADFAQAVAQYLHALTFAQHVSQNKLLISIMVSSAIEGLAFRPLQQYLEKEQADPQIYAEISAFLQKITARRNTLAEAMEREKERYIWAGQQWVTSLKDKLETQQDLIQPFKKVADEYYGRLIKFARTNAEADRQSFLEQIDSLKQKHALEGKTNQACIEQMSFLISGSAEHKPEDLAGTIAELLVVVSLPDLVKAWEVYYLAEAKFRILKIAAAIRTYVAQNGDFPQALSELVPAYLDSVPLDPWSEGDVRYIRNEDSWLVYSFGPDRQDNSGSGTGYETSKELQGKDIVFKGWAGIF